VSFESNGKELLKFAEKGKTYVDGSPIEFFENDFADMVRMFFCSYMEEMR